MIHSSCFMRVYRHRLLDGSTFCRLRPSNYLHIIDLIAYNLGLLVSLTQLHTRDHDLLELSTGICIIH